VAIGVGRPGKASSAAGISTFFRNVNMSGTSCVQAKYKPWRVAAQPQLRSRFSLGSGAVAVRGLAGRDAGYGPRSGAILPLIDKEQAVFLAAPMKVFPAPLVALAVKPFAVLSVEVDWGTLLPRTHNSTCDSSVSGQHAH
jgi:hypothetical protein